jgi:hypothetical protein
MAAFRTTIRLGCLTAHNTLQSRIALDTPPTQKPTPRLRRKKIENFFDYGRTLFQTLMRSQVNRHQESGDWHRTVCIKTLGVGTTEFDLD